MVYHCHLVFPKDWPAGAAVGLGIRQGAFRCGVPVLLGELRDVPIH